MNDSSPPQRGARPARGSRLVLALLASALLAAPIFSLAAPAMAVPSAPQSAASPAKPLLTAAKPARAFFGLGPASKTAIDGRPYFAWSATPDGALTDYVALVNFGAVPVTLHVFASNAVSLAHGGTGFESAGQSRGGPASWITLHFPNGSATVHLKPRSKEIVPITLQVPHNAPPGDHEGAIIASLTSTIVSKNHAKVHLVQQVAARIVLRVSGKLRPLLTVSGLRVTYDNKLSPTQSGVATLHFTIDNSGNLLLGGTPVVTVSGLFGSSAARHVATVPVLLPGGSDSESVTIPGVYPQFLMNAKVTLTPTAVVGQDDNGLLSRYSANTSFWAVPVILLIVVIVLILLAGVWIWRHRRRRITTPGGATAVPSEVGA
jgi:hypothetical protein